AADGIVAAIEDRQIQLVGPGRDRRAGSQHGRTAVVERSGQCSHAPVAEEFAADTHGWCGRGLGVEGEVVRVGDRLCGGVNAPGRPVQLGDEAVVGVAAGKAGELVGEEGEVETEEIRIQGDVEVDFQDDRVVDQATGAAESQAVVNTRKG